MNINSNVSKIKRKRNEENNDPIDGERNKCAKKSNNSSFKNPKTTQTGRAKRQVCFSVAPLGTITRSKLRALGGSNSNVPKNGIQIDEKQEKNNFIQNKCKSIANDKSSENLGLNSNNSVSKKKSAITIPTPVSAVTRSKTRALDGSNSNAPKNGMRIDEKQKTNNYIRNKWKSIANDKSSENFGLNSNNSVPEIKRANVIPIPASAVTCSKTHALAVDSPLRAQKSNRAIKKTASVKIGDLVWSKLTGWPYWPSTVEAIMPDGKIRVRFIEKKSRFADVKIENIVTFMEGCFDKKIKADVQKNATLNKCVKDAITKMIALDLMNSSYDHI